ncbi:MAG: response regulator [bacterium]|nr:response regulator [bacterium]
MKNEKPPRKTVLVVDDEKNNLILLCNLLSEAGYNTRPASSGDKALSIIKKFPPDIILLDIKMPGMSGYEVCRILKNQEGTGSIPVLFLSALDDLADKLKGFEAGAVDYITKPFQDDEVIARVKTHLELYAQRAKQKKTGAYERSGLDESRKDEYLELIKNYMRENKEYLESSFNIDEMGANTGLSRHKISEVINSKLGKNFNTFVNEYRVKRLVDEVTGEDLKKRTILEIYLEYGFNSKSVFNTAFKKFTGKTPKEFFKDKS